MATLAKPNRQAFDGARMTFTLETRDLTIRFGGHVAVNRVSCTFRPGELTAIVGPNGAGKTTYFNLISGQVRPSDGSILLDGADITQLSAPLRTRAGLGRAGRDVPEGRPATARSRLAHHCEPSRSAPKVCCSPCSLLTVSIVFMALHLILASRLRLRPQIFCICTIYLGTVDAVLRFGKSFDG